MTMRKLRYVLSFLFALALVAGCGGPADSGFHGSLYFAQGSYLMRYGLRDASLSMVAQFGDRKIREISPFGPDRLLVAETATINRTAVSRIAWIDKNSGRSEPLYSGVRARYIPDPGVILYDDGSTLYAVSLSAESEVDSVVLTHRRNQLAAIVVTGEDSALIETAGEDAPRIQAYHAPSGELTALDALAEQCRLQGAVWIGHLDLLACRPRQGQAETGQPAYRLVGLEGRVARDLALPEGGEFLALDYVAGQGALLFRESWRSDFSGQLEAVLWAHDLGSGDNRRLADSLNIGTSVVYSAR